MEIQEAIMKHVLRYVPAKSLCRFKLVSKEWNNWISSSFLAHQQATHFTKTSGFFYQSNSLFLSNDPSFIPLDPDSHGVAVPSLSFLPHPTSIRTTSHGLLCCKSTSEDNTYFICNPTTKEWKELPKPSLFHGSSSAIALAFSPSTYNFHSHFQLVCAVHDPFDCVNVVDFEIYSSRTNSWRRAPSQYCFGYVNVDVDVDVNADGGLVFNGDGFCMEGSYVYWETSNGVVLGFDLRHEEHGEISLPLPLSCGLGALTEICGELCYVMVMTCDDRDMDETDVDDDGDGDGDYYSLAFYGGHDMTLKRRIPLDLGDFGGDRDDRVVVRVLSEVRDGVVMILVGSNVILYDVEERKGDFVRKVRPTERVGRFLLYVNSLVKVCPIENMPPEDRHFDELLKNMSDEYGWKWD